jgi:hypothetical protein
MLDDVVFENMSAAFRIVPLLGPEVATKLGARGEGLRRIANRRRAAPAASRSRHAAGARGGMILKTRGPIFRKPTVRGAAARAHAG